MRIGYELILIMFYLWRRRIIIKLFYYMNIRNINRKANKNKLNKFILFNNNNIIIKQFILYIMYK
jgi:hypothetical protein